MLRDDKALSMIYRLLIYHFQSKWLINLRQIIDDALDKRPNLRLRPYEKDNVLDILRSYKMTGKETEPPLIVKQTVRFTI